MLLCQRFNDNKLLLWLLKQSLSKLNICFSLNLPCVQKYSRLRCLLLCQKFIDIKLLLIEKIVVKTEYQFQFSLPCRLRCLLWLSDYFIFTNPFHTYLKDVGVCKVLTKTSTLYTPRFNPQRLISFLFSVKMIFCEMTANICYCIIVVLVPFDLFFEFQNQC